MIKVLNDFGFTDINLSIEEIIDTDQLIMLGRPPLRIDILTSISGVEFNEAFKNKFVHDLGHIKSVNFISFEEKSNFAASTGLASLTSVFVAASTA